MIKLTFEFQTVDEAVQFLTRDKAQPVVNVTVPKSKAAKKAAPPAVEQSPEQQATEPQIPHIVADSKLSPAPSIRQLTDPAFTLPEPVKAAPKAPNAPVQAVAGITLDAARNALREVFNTKGAAVATTILTDFGAASISQVKPKDFAAFIKACQK